MSQIEVEADAQKAKPPKPETILAKVMTTSGVHPRKGYEEVKPKEKVDKFLREAARALHLTDVEGWAAKVDGREINPEKSFAENSLAGEVCIQWNPPEGGGGA